MDDPLEDTDGGAPSAESHHTYWDPDMENENGSRSSCSDETRYRTSSTAVVESSAYTHSNNFRPSIARPETDAQFGAIKLSKGSFRENGKVKNGRQMVSSFSTGRYILPRRRLRVIHERTH